MSSNLTIPTETPPVLTPVGRSYGSHQENAGIDLRMIWSMIYRNRFLIAAVTGLALVIGVALTVFSTKMYQATASIQIEAQIAKVLGSSSDSDDPGIAAGEMDRFLQTQVDILKSRALAERVAESLDLYSGHRFLDRMAGRPTPASSPADTRMAVVATLRRHLDITLPRNSHIVSLAFESPDPALAAQIANTYAQDFIVSNLQRRFDASAYTRAFLEDQLKIAKQRLENSERATIAYSREAGLLDTSDGSQSAAGSTSGGDTTGGGRSLTTSQLVQLNSALVEAKTARVAAQQRWEAAEKTPLLSLPEVQSNQAVTQLSQQRAMAQAAYQQDLQRRKPDYPTMKQAAANIAELDRQINQLAASIRDGIRDQFQIAARQEQSLAESVNQLKSASLSEQDRSVRLNILKREADTNRSMYDALLSRYREVSAQAGVTINNISVLDKADQPLLPVRPRPLMNLALALLAGLGLSALAVFIRERFDDAVRSPEDVRQKLAIPFINSIPALAAGVTPREAIEEKRSSFSEAYYALRASLQLVSSNGLPRSILFTSSREAEGKSTSSLSIARSFAMIGLRVLLIDGDLRKPSLHRLLETRSTPGLSSVLSRQLGLADVVQETSVENMFFVPTGMSPPSPTELLSGSSLPELIAEAREFYDLVVIDGPPVLGLADAILYAVAVEGTVYIVEAGRANYGGGRAALQRLIDAGANVIGAVLTKFNPRNAGYGYEYSYYYSYGSPDQKAIGS